MAAAVTPSFSTNFWGQGERGSEVVINKLHQGAQTCEELLSYYKERAALEEEYARRLNAISKKTCGTFETGHLREAFEILRNETEQISRSHLNQSRKLHTDSIAKLDSFLSNFVARRKPVESSVENIRKTKQALEGQVNRLRERYQVEANKLNTYLAQESLLLGKELDKNREKIYRQQTMVAEIRQEYQIGCQKLEEIHNTWINEWSISSAKLEELECERIEFLVSNMWEYSNAVSSSCVNDDAACENLRKGLEECDTRGEIEIFTKKFGTGTKIFSSQGFVDYVKGDTEEKGRVHVIQDSRSRHSSQGTILSQNIPTGRVQSDNSQKTIPVAKSQHIQAPQIQMQHPHSFEHLKPRNMHRRPPPSDDGQTSISNPSTNSTSLHREESAYSNPTSISSFAESVNGEARVSKTWNSPLRRRSRNSEMGDSWMRRGNSNNSNRRSFILEQNPAPRRPQSEFIIPPNEDPLRATLEDLKHGGNGDMNKLKEALSKNNSLKGMEYSSKPDFGSSMSSQHTTGTTIRPKSMIADFESHQREQRDHDDRIEKQMKRSSFHAGLRSMSKSSVNLQAKMSTSGLPSMTREGRRVIKHARAVFDFTATIEGELTFKEGDTLLVVHMQEDGWWECERLDNGEVGLAPYNYLEQI
ncbi:Septation protein imp2 [Cyberlindnera fabianii]|uniref:Septation protein imp2 n=1 Tax=Cyberlindnera fabianii TaxID=36022 RepID=A0A1V2L718_CYBFA|nr:Septation protein imp2 [Cyberlindnera fabianii]